MTSRKKQLEFCKICTHQKFALEHGIICGLTNMPADFKKTCPSFNEDKEIKQAIERQKTNRILNNKPANKKRRLVNFLLDFIFFLILATALKYVTEIIVFVYSPDSLSYFRQYNPEKDYPITAFIYFSYYTILEITTGRTIAKHITKTRVVNYQGEKPSFLQVIIRSIIRFIPFECITFYLDREGKGWHDRISKTRVVKE